MSRPASSWARIAISVASSCASARYCGGMRQSSLARTRGGKRPASLARSISHSGCGKLPTMVVGNSMCVVSGMREKVGSDAEVGALDLGPREQVVRLAFGDDTAFLEDVRAVGERHRHLDVLLDQQHRHA